MSRIFQVAIRCALPIGLALLLPACSLFSTTPSPAKRQAVRDALPYGMDIAQAQSKLSGLGFACSRRTGNYTDEGGAEHSSERFLFCEQRPNTISFACENRDQVTVIDRDGTVSGIEVTRGPSCQPASPPPATRFK